MVRRLMAMAAGGLALAFAIAPTGALHSQVTQGQNPSPPPWAEAGAAQGAQGEVRADSAFILEVATDNIMEVRLGRLAADRATNPSVKQFGEQMVADHEKIQKQWIDMASKNGIRVYDKLMRMSGEEADRLKAETDRLGKVSGAEFDRDYMTSMIQNHENAVSKFQSQGRFAQSAQVRDLVTAGLPVLQQHLSLARQIGSQVGAGTGVAVTQNPPVAGQNPPTVNQNPPVSPQNQQARERDLSADREFSKDVGAGNFMLVRLAELAQKKAKDSAVRQFAERDAADHARLEDQWNAMISRQGLPSNRGMGPLHKVKLDRLEKVSDRNFDRSYMTLMIRQHHDMVTYWRKEGRASHLAQVRELVNQGLPTLERHLSEAKRIGRRVGVDPEAVLRNREDIARDRAETRSRVRSER
jgi:putative membrane protein